MVTQTQLFPPPVRDSNLPQPLQKYLFTLQMLLPLVVVDTSGGSFAQSPPPAGLNASTGQSNQNMEITYVKKSADGNTFTLNGVQFGPYVLIAQGDSLKIKSDGTNWYKVAP